MIGLLGCMSKMTMKSILIHKLCSRSEPGHPAGHESVEGNDFTNQRSQNVMQCKGEILIAGHWPLLALCLQWLP